MLMGDVGILAEKIGVSKQTIYNIANKIGLDISPNKKRCDRTIDFISGETIDEEHKKWLDMAENKIIEFRGKKKERKPRNKKYDNPEQMQVLPILEA